MSVTSANVESIYDIYSPFYNIIFSKVLDSARKKAIKEMSIKDRDKIIEVGVGTGLSFRHYNKQAEGISLTGIDLSSKMLKKAQQKAKAFKNLKIDLSHINGENTPFPDETFDKVVLMYVYSVTPNPEKLLQEAFRICKKSGSVYIINHFSNFKNGRMNIAERMLSHYSTKVGFRSNFSYARYITDLNLNISSIQSANLFALTKIIQLPKSNNSHIQSMN